MNQDELKDAMASLLKDQQRAQDEMKRALEEVQQGEPTSADLMKMQEAMQKWSMTIQMQSNMIQELNDALKGIIGKMG